MPIETYCALNPEQDASQLGNPGQGLHFIRHALRPVLANLSSTPESDRTLLCFALPNELPRTEHTQLYAAFSWPFSEFPPECSTAPIEQWRQGLHSCRGAIAFSSRTAEAIHALVGNDYPVLVLPAQPSERFNHLCPIEGLLAAHTKKELNFTGHMLDSPRIGLSVEGLALQSPEPEPEPEPEALASNEKSLNFISRLDLSMSLLKGWWHEAFSQYIIKTKNSQYVEQPQHTTTNTSPEHDTHHHLKLYGVVYTSVLRAEDEQHIWLQLVMAFCWTFREQPNATLIIKFTHYNETSGRIALLTALSQLSPFRCRVIAINAFLATSQYEDLIAASHFLVHPSQAEASALVAQEFMSAGRPVIGPRYAALADWITPINAFIVDGHAQPTYWEKDPSRGLHHSSLRLNWQSLCHALDQSFRVAQEDPGHYQKISKNARAEIASRASKDQIKNTLEAFLSPFQNDKDHGKAE